MRTTKKSIMALSALFVCSTQCQGTESYPAESFEPPILAQQFSNVRFSDPHVKVRFINSYDCKDTFRIMFGKPEHLQELIDTPIYISARKIYYVYEPDREELGFSNNAYKSLMVSVVGPKKLTSYGSLELTDGLGIVFPPQHDFKNITFTTKYFSSFDFLSQAKDLKAVSDLAFNLESKQPRVDQLTNDANMLMNMIRKKDLKD